ncbi:MAG: nucleotidyltransferase family protein [Longimicrobiaceae bacterium]
MGARSPRRGRNTAKALISLLTGRPLPATGGVVWDRVLRLAREHGLSGLVAVRAQARADAASIPLGFRATCEEDLTRVRLRNRLFLEEARRVSAQLEARGVEHCFFKGVALLGTAYPDDGTRVLSDLDLAVPEEEAGSAVEGLEEAGFRSEFSDPLERVALQGEVSFLARGNWPGGARPTLDLHSRFEYARVSPASGRVGSDVAPLLFRAAGHSPHRLPVPDPSVHLAVIVQHLVHHLPREFYGKWVMDVEGLARLREVDWPLVEETLAGLHAARSGGLLLTELRRSLGVPVPVRVTESLGGESGAAGGLRLESLLARGRLSRWRGYGYLWQMRTHDRPSALAAGLLRLWWPGEEWLRLRYPDRAGQATLRLRLHHAARLAVTTLHDFHPDYLRRRRARPGLTEKK